MDQLMLIISGTIINIYTAAWAIHPMLGFFRRQGNRNFQELLHKLAIATTPEHYDPNFGYEPYWPGGDWFAAAPEGETTEMKTVCGDECDHIYAAVGEVCAHRVDRYESVNRQDIGLNLITHLDNYDRAFETIPSYCQFLDRQCKEKISTNWVFVNVGKCVVQPDVFKPVDTAANPGNQNWRADVYLNDLTKRMNGSVPFT